MARFCFLLLLLLGTTKLYAQNPGRFKLQKISVEKGLSQSVVTGITQDSLGFLWFSTLDGVNRYDGYHFDNFYNQKDNPFSLSNNFTNAILCDYDNEIWVGTLDGLCKYDYSTERFTVFHHIDGDSGSLSNSEITCLALSKSGNIWVGTNNGGINLYDKKSRKFSHFMYRPGVNGSIASNNISALYEDNNGKLWVGLFESGLDCMDLTSGKIIHITIPGDPKNPFLFSHIRCIYQDIFGNNWIGTDNGLIHQIIKNNKFQIFSYNPHSACSINGNRVNSITCDAENNLWVGTEENGINIIKLSSVYSGESNVCFNQIGMQENEYGLSIRTVLSIFKDRDKNMWIGTYSGGINFISSLSLKFQKYQHNPYDQNTINYPKVWGLCEDKYGNIWIGTDGAGLDVLNSKTNKIKHFLHNKNNPSSISDNAILCALRDHNNDLWFGTYEGGLNRYNEKTNSFKVYRDSRGVPNSFPHNDVRVIHEDKQQNLWIGTNGGGLCKYNPNNDNFEIYTPFNSTLTTGNVRALLSDTSGNLYIGTYSRGLDIFNTKTGKTRNYSHQRNKSNSISDNYIYALAFATGGDVWVGTGNGLNLLHIATGAFEVFNERNGLANNFIHAILIDKNSNVWVSTNKGISKFIITEKKFENFDSYDGLQTGEFNDGSALYASDGLMWFGGINGLNSFNPEKVSKDPFQPKLVISGFQLYNNPVKARTKENPESPLLLSISTAKKVELNYKQSVFTIEFVALNYSFPEKTKYAYKLKGLDRDWNEVGNSRSATYRDLEAGRYVFEVKASNQDGLWTETPTSLVIIVKPPFWKTWWAYLLYVIVIVSIAYLIYKDYKKQNALKNKLFLEQMSHQKDLELNQERFRFFTNISHEFRTPLTLILGPVEELLEKENQSSAMSQKLGLIFKNAHKLLDLINMLLDFRKVETGNMKLRVTKRNIVKFTSDLMNGYQDLASSKNISLHFNTTSKEIEAWFDPEKFEIIYNNLLSNALKFTSNGGSITVTIQERKAQYLKVDNEIIEICVSDTGIGIAKKHVDHIFDSYYSIEHSGGIKGTGIGLALTKSLVEMHKGKIVVKSVEHKGSTFIIEISKGNSHFEPEQILDDYDGKGNAQTTKKVIVQNSSSTDSTDLDLDPEKLVDKKIMLIVEDNIDVRTYIGSNFSEKFSILQADNGSEGFKLACKHVPDIIISDVMMPEMDGIEFCNKIKTTVSTCHIPVILLTARSSITHKKEGYETGADSYVTKPFSVDLLSSRVENLLKSRKQLKEYYTKSILLQPSAVTSESPDDKFMKQLLGLIEKYISDPDFDITKLASELSMSRPVLYRKVKALTDFSIIEFIRTVRMNRASQLLKTGQYRVSEVAFAVGFSDPKYFRKCFKEQFNINPSDLSRNKDLDDITEN